MRSGDKIKRRTEYYQFARENAGYSQEDFASLLSYTPAGWQKIEQGQRKLSYEHIEKVNKSLKLIYVFILD